MTRANVLRLCRALMLLGMVCELLVTIGYPSSSYRVAQNVYAPLWHEETRSSKTTGIYYTTCMSCCLIVVAILQLYKAATRHHLCSVNEVVCSVNVASTLHNMQDIMPPGIVSSSNEHGILGCQQAGSAGILWFLVATLLLLAAAASPVYSHSALLQRCQSTMAYNTSSGMFHSGPLSLWIGTEAMFAAAPAAAWATWQQLIMTAKAPWCARPLQDSLVTTEESCAAAQHALNAHGTACTAPALHVTPGSAAVLQAC